MSQLSLSSADIAARYDLICRATQVNQQDHGASDMEFALELLQKMLKQDLRILARRGSPDNFSDIYFALEQELLRLREFCAFPSLAQKFKIGFGGAFSAGKSSLINNLLGQRLLATEVDPTTSLPTFLLQGDADKVFALNLHRHRIELSHEEFLSLTHDEGRLFGSSVASLLRAAFRTTVSFPWQNLALIDTPGYSKPDTDTHSDRTDEHVARAQLNAAQAIVWLISADTGTISEDDLRFLASLRADIPRIVVVTRADKKTAKDIADVVAGITRTLSDRHLPALAVIPISNRNKADYPIAPLFAQLDRWNQQPKKIQIAQNFKQQFKLYTRFIENQQRLAQLHFNRLNRILVLADADDIQQDAEELKQTAKTEYDQLSQVADDLHIFQQKFFLQLKRIGESVGIDFPESADLDITELLQVDLLAMLRKLRAEKGGAEPDYQHLWRSLYGEIPPDRLAQLLRRTSSRHLPLLAKLNS